MRCPECIEQGLTSKVYDNGGTKTLLGWAPYWDENDEYHSHDPNQVTNYYQCSNKHGWGVRQKLHPCPNHKCHWPGMEKREIK